VISTRHDVTTTCLEVISTRHDGATTWTVVGVRRAQQPPTRRRHPGRVPSSIEP
jgi:hypothetical protein